MRTISISVGFIVLSGAAASAADSPYYTPPYSEPRIAPEYDWSGGYIGVHGGYGWGKMSGVSSSASGTGGGLSGIGGGLLEDLLSVTTTTTTDILGDIDEGILGDLLDDVVGDNEVGDLLDDLLGGGGVLPPLFDTTTEILDGVGDALALGAADLDLELRGSDLENIEDLEGFLIGGQFGYNWQSGAIVAGIEGDIAYSDMQNQASFEASDSFEDIDVGGVVEVSGSVAVEGTVTNEMNWLGTLRGRVGVAQNRLLIFGTGGVAFGDASVAAQITTTSTTEVEVIGEGIEVVTDTTTVTGVGDDTMIGYTVGAGVEFGVTENISAKIEYAYVNLGEIQVEFDDGSTTDVEVDMHLVKGGMNYRF